MLLSPLRPLASPIASHTISFDDSAYLTNILLFWGSHECVGKKNPIDAMREYFSLLIDSIIFSDAMLKMAGICLLVKKDVDFIIFSEWN